MAYSKNIPQPTDRIKDSQSKILANFTAIPNLLEINHKGFDGGADDGKHIKVDFTNSTTHPEVLAGQMLIYNFVNPLTTTNELYVKKVGAVATAGTPFTASTKATAGYTYLPSGILMKWGYATVKDTPTVITTTPYFSAIYNIQVTTITQDVAQKNRMALLQTWSLGATSFTMNISGQKFQSSTTAATTYCYWMAIGS